MTGLMARAEAIVAEVVEEHQPGPDGFEDFCYGHDEPTSWSGAHVAAAVMAALAERLGLAEEGGDRLVHVGPHDGDMAIRKIHRLVTTWQDTTTEGAPA